MARSKLAVALVLAGAVASPAAHALGLGMVEVKSTLNQPLDARIPLLPANLAELETLSISLASTEAFQRAGIDRPFALTRLKFTVVRGDNPFVRVSTEQPVKEPFLDFLVQADWANGRLIREFTLLLDPPIYGGQQVVAPRVATAAAPATVGSRPVAAQAAAPAVAAYTAVPAGAAAAAVAAAGDGRTYGPVTANDTLWRIARNVRADSSVSINQMMVALLRANPDAFIDGDINRLRRGSTLHIPATPVVASIDAAAANQEVRSQMQRWRQETARGRLQVVAPPEQSTEKVDGSSPEQAAANSASLESLQQELRSFRESNISLQAENEDLQAQVEGLKQELAQFERLLNLAAQQPIAAAGDTAGSDATAAEPVVEESGSTEAVTPVSAAEQPAAAAAEEPAPRTTPVAAEAPTPGFFDEPRNVASIGGLFLALLGLIYLAVRRRRAAAQDDAEVAMPLVEAEPVAESEAEPVLEADKMAELLAEDDAEPAQPDLDDIPADSDALSEAEVYLAYGRYDQARELLDKALAEEPEHADLRLKLLETMALLQDEEGFVVQAQLLQSQVGETDAAWQRACEMGREFLPDEPLFAEATAVVELAGDAATDMVFDIELDDPDFELPESAPVTAAAEPSSAAGAGAVALEEVTDADDDFSLDFELPEFKSEQAEAELESDLEPDTEAALTMAEAPLSLEDGLELADAPTLTEAAGAGDDVVALDLDGLQLDEPLAADSDDNVLDFSLPESDSNAVDDQLDQLDDLDEVGIKLNLARAYLDMGDNDGARSLIDEVLAEGSSKQQQEAEDLLQQFA